MKLQHFSRAAAAALLSLAAVGPAAAAARKLPGSNTVLAGAMVYNDLWGETDANGNYLNPITSGIYTFGARADAEPKLVYRNDKMLKLRAAVKVNSVYYAISTSNYDSEAYLTTYTTGTWGQRSEAEIDLVNVPSDMAYDPVSGNIYGFFYNEATQEYSRFCSFDTYYGEATTIAEVDRNAFAIAANKNGEIYGIWGYTGWLIKIDPKTGRYEQIGKTGFAPAYINSMAFDDATGKLYWTANDAEGYSALLEVNTSTGAATEICHFKNNASFAGIFAMPYTIPDAAPAAVGNAAVKFSHIGALTGTVECVAPTKTHNGASLAGPLTIVVSVVGGSDIEINGVEPGAKVVSPEITFAEGNVSVEITAASTDYLGETVSISTYAGEDTPGAPSEVTLIDDGGVPSLSWSAPAAGLNGGVFDPAGLTYTVTRMPDKTKFEGITSTTFRDETFGGMAALHYLVQAVNAKGTGPAAESQTLVFGADFSVPFTEKFDSKDAFDLWTVTDLAGASGWTYDTKAKNIYLKYCEPEQAHNDWIVSPRVRLQKDAVYALTFDAKTFYKGYPENFKFCIGESTDPASMKQVIIDCPDYDNPKAFESKRALFHVEADGYYHIGLNCYSIAHNWQLTIDNIGVAEVSGAVPAAVNNLTVTAAPLGAMSATVEFTAPELDTKGGDLTENLTVNIYRNLSATPLKTISGVAPGSRQSWIDATMTEADTYAYRVVAATEAGEGASAEASAFVGVDVPGPVGDLRAIERTDGTVELSWSAPVVGANGGYFNPEGMTYRVMRSNDAKVVASATSETSLTDRLNLSHQELMYYLVTPYVGEVKGMYNNTPLNGVFGPAIAAPMTETFAGADIANYPWVSESDGPNYLWVLEAAGVNPATADQNGDRGLAMFVSSADNVGVTGEFSSPKVNISTLDKPVISFWVYHFDGLGNDAMLTLKVMTPGKNFEAVEGAVVRPGDGTTGWRRHVVDLSAYKFSEWLRVMFVSTSTGSGNILLDNIVVDNSRGVDVAVDRISGSRRVAAGFDAPFTARVGNVGMEDAKSITVTLADGSGRTLAAESLAALGAGKYVDVEFSAALAMGNHALTVTATCGADANPANNVATLAVEAVDAVIASPSSLRASATEGAVLLSWDAPYGRGHVVDDVESYADWAINGVGDYTLIDLDYNNTHYIHKDLDEYPSMTSPKSFQVCNAKTLGIDIWGEGTPHSGNKMFMSVASVDGANNDWLISPLLNGAEQTVSFHAKAFTAQDTPAERMRVLYSTGSTDPTEFTPVHSAEFIEVPDQWMEYRYVVPAGTRYFAINCVSLDAFALFVDDLAFNDMTVPALELTGYEVMRNGEVVATVTDESYVDSEPVAGKSTYTVRALFGDVVSSPSEAAAVEFSAIAEIEGGAGVADEAVYDLQGRRVAAAPRRGIYIKVSGGKACKELIR